MRSICWLTLAAWLVPAAFAPSPAQTPPAQTPPAQNPPVPLPFPGSPPPSTTARPPANPTAPSTPPAGSNATSASPRPTPPPPAPAVTPIGANPATTNSAATSDEPTEASLGVKFFPGAEFLQSFDAGRGQRLYLFGTTATYAEVIAFYKSELRSSSELWKEPGVQRFDLPGTRFQAETMAYPPSVVVKDYTWTGVDGTLPATGYLFVSGSTEKRFKTIVQIVPAQAK